jgi:hypothetical protein
LAHVHGAVVREIGNACSWTSPWNSIVSQPSRHRFRKWQ